MPSQAVTVHCTSNSISPEVRARLRAHGRLTTAAVRHAYAYPPVASHVASHVTAKTYTPGSQAQGQAQLQFLKPLISQVVKGLGLSMSHRCCPAQHNVSFPWRNRLIQSQAEREVNRADGFATQADFLNKSMLVYWTEMQFQPSIQSESSNRKDGWSCT